MVRRAVVLLVLAVAALLLTGCVSNEVKELVHDNAVLQLRMVELMNEGRATAEDIQANARINALGWWNFDRLLQGTPPTNDEKRAFLEKLQLEVPLP